MSRELLDTADFLLSRPGGPTPADKCRAISTIYYALFHFLSGNSCKLFIGDPAAGVQPQRAWDHLYRSLAHTTLDERCRETSKLRTKGFPQQIIDFADFVRTMQWKREKCDYGHAVDPIIASIPSDIVQARDHMDKFEQLDEKHRKAFAIYILFKDNKSEKKLITV